MTSQLILEKAIQKAIESGWLPYFANFDSNMTKDNIVIRYPKGATSVNFDYTMSGHVVGVGGYNLEPYSIIFNHDFAKALWGEGAVDSNGNVSQIEVGDERVIYKPIYLWHLQRMVIAENPLEYLKENL